MTSTRSPATTRELVVLDFETAGLLPAYDRTIEVAATLLVDALQVRSPEAREFHRSVADVNHTIAIWQSLHARFTEHTGLAAPPVHVLGALTRKPKMQVEKYLARLRASSGLPPSDPARDGIRCYIQVHARQQRSPDYRPEDTHQGRHRPGHP